jgi:hypothetical protein
MLKLIELPLNPPGRGILELGERELGERRYHAVNPCTLKRGHLI